MVYESINNSKIKELKKLNIKKYRDESGLFLLEGEHLIREAYLTNNLKSVIILDGYDMNINIDKIYVNDKIMKYISQLDSIPKFIGVGYKLKNKGYGNKIMVLDNIQDPGNLGTIIRSCVAFNCDTLILSNNTVDLYNSKVIRASQGMLFHLNIIVCDLEKELPKLIEKQYRIIGTDVSKGKDINQFAKCDKFVIIMGNEGNGLSSFIKPLCDDFIYIPMNKICESLNVGVASSIILYELR